MIIVDRMEIRKKKKKNIYEKLEKLLNTLDQSQEDE